MPQVKFDYVVSVSSEDPEHPASNLLPREVSKKKWLCKKGDPSGSVVLQLSRACKISSVSIGAHHAAMVEVLAGRAAAPGEPEQVLVPKSVFVSAGESRRGAGVASVRSFPVDSAQRWDRLRVQLHQPYNRHAQFGLSFVHVFSSDEGSAPPPADHDDDDTFTPGELFAAHREQARNDTGAQIRQASSRVLKNISEDGSKLVKTPLKRPSEQSSTRESTLGPGPSARNDRNTDSRQSDQRRDDTRQDDKRHDGKRRRDDHERRDDNHQDDQRRDDQEQRPDLGDADHVGDASNKWDARHSGRACAQPLAGAALVLSGYSGEQRAAARRAAERLGARLLPAWEPAATHLICAFPGTPKLRAARAGGGRVRAARRSWLQACLARGRLVPWRRHATDPADRTSASTSDDDDDDDDDDEPETEEENQEEIAEVAGARLAARLAARRVAVRGARAGALARAARALGARLAQDAEVAQATRTARLRVVAARWLWRRLDARTLPTG